MPQCRALCRTAADASLDLLVEGVPAAQQRGGGRSGAGWQPARAGWPWEEGSQHSRVRNRDHQPAPTTRGQARCQARGTPPPPTPPVHNSHAPPQVLVVLHELRARQAHTPRSEQQGQGTDSTAVRPSPCCPGCRSRACSASGSLRACPQGTWLTSIRSGVFFLFCEPAQQAGVSRRRSSSSKSDRTQLLAGAPQRARRAAPALLCSGPLCSTPPAAHLLRHVAGGGAALSAGLRALQGDDQPHTCTQCAATVSLTPAQPLAQSNRLCTQHSNSLRLRLRGRALHPPFFLACKTDRRQRGQRRGYGQDSHDNTRPCSANRLPPCAVACYAHRHTCATARLTMQVTCRGAWLLCCGAARRKVLWKRCPRNAVVSCTIAAAAAGSPGHCQKSGDSSEQRAQRPQAIRLLLFVANLAGAVRPVVHLAHRADSGLSRRQTRHFPAMRVRVRAGAQTVRVEVPGSSCSWAELRRAIAAQLGLPSDQEDELQLSLNKRVRPARARAPWTRAGTTTLQRRHHVAPAHLLMASWGTVGRTNGPWVCCTESTSPPTPAVRPPAGATQDALAGDEEADVKSLGIAGGDLLWVLHPGFSDPPPPGGLV